MTLEGKKCHLYDLLESFYTSPYKYDLYAYPKKTKYSLKQGVLRYKEYILLMCTYKKVGSSCVLHSPIKDINDINFFYYVYA